MFCVLQAGIGSEEETLHDSMPDALEEGLRFGVYEIDCREDGRLYELGRGAMGITYRATDTSLQRKVALKIIKTDIAERSADARERFMREARAAAALRHENIATIHQFGMRLETGQYFYAMELIEGETLHDRVRRAGPLDARTTIEIAQQVTSALVAAEKHGLVHRDLKPANLMLVSPDGQTSNNKKLLVKIIDFGLAKAVPSETDPKSLTHDRFVGTPAFASPEQFEHSALDVRSDIYSLGETLWFALTGKPPFAGHTLSEIHHAQKSNALPVEQLKAAHVPHRLKSLLESMLAFEPASRPGTHELAARLQRCSPAARHVQRTRLALAASLITLAAAAGWIIWKSELFRVPSEKSIAVLPFEDLSQDKANAYFADGTQNEILTKLAGIGDLKVISRTSSAKYKSKPENLKTVARELGVATVLEGSVQKAGDRVRVNVQLLDARSDTHLWAKSYDRNFNDIFAVESDVAQEIAAALKAKLSSTQANALAAAPTRDIEAYDLFLKGEYEEREAESTYKGEIYDRAASFYRQALTRDPSFALAYARLAYNRLYRHWYVGRLTPAQLEEVKSDAERAVAIAPDLPEAHLALGLFHYWGRHDFDPALKEFDRAIELQSSDSVSREFRAAIYRRRGEFRRALAEFERGIELDPRDVWKSDNIGSTYLLLRRWGEAEHWLKHALALDPHHVGAAYRLHLAYIGSTGNIQSARRAWEGVPNEKRTVTVGAYEIIVPQMIDDRVYLDVLERHFPKALKEWDAAPDNTVEGRLTQLKARIGIQVLAGQNAAAERECEEARVLLEAQSAQRRPEEDRTSSVSELAWIYVCLGRNADALRVAREAAEAMPIEKDAVLGVNFLVGLAQIEAHTGQSEQAVKLLRRLLTMPAGEYISVARLKIDPVWDPIRDNPGFQKLLSEPEPETVYK